MDGADDAYSIPSTWSCYWLDQFLTLALNILILSIFYISMDLSTNYFAHFSGCWASFACSCHYPRMLCHVFWSQVEYKIVCFIYLQCCDIRRNFFVRPVYYKTLIHKNDVTSLVKLHKILRLVFSMQNLTRLVTSFLWFQNSTRWFLGISKSTFLPIAVYFSVKLCRLISVTIWWFIVY